jgi:hypothetical protein
MAPDGHNMCVETHDNRLRQPLAFLAAEKGPAAPIPRAQGPVAATLPAGLATCKALPPGCGPNLLRRPRNKSSPASRPLLHTDTGKLL